MVRRKGSQLVTCGQRDRQVKKYRVQLDSLRFNRDKSDVLGAKYRAILVTAIKPASWFGKIRDQAPYICLRGRGRLLKQVTSHITCHPFRLKHNTRANIDAHIRFSGMRLASQPNEAVSVFAHACSTLQIELNKCTADLG